MVVGRHQTARAEGRAERAEGQRQIRKFQQKVGFTSLEESGGEGVRHDGRRRGTGFTVYGNWGLAVMMADSESEVPIRRGRCRGRSLAWRR